MKRVIGPNVAKVLIAKGWKLMITGQLELELFEGQETSVAWHAWPENSMVEAVILLPSNSQVTDTDITSVMQFKSKEIRHFLGLINNT